MAIEIAQYDPAWPKQAAQIADALRRTVPGTFTRIEHVGSTSVPGLAAKPVIDLMAGVDDLSAAAARLDAELPALDFLPQDNGMSGRLFYYRDRDGRRVSHLHVVPEETLATRNEVLLRDLLRRSPADADRYAALKRALAAANGEDGYAYTRGKTDLIQELVDRARGEAGLEPVRVWED
jgi:GrpB-like predicted nucleotidyltransferase (UPF0157 family)